jgi:predicted nucleic acid-binding protein
VSQELERRLEQSIEAGVVCLDTSAVLAYLDGEEPTSAAAAVLLDRMVRTGRNIGIISTVTVTEALVRPFRVEAQGTAAPSAGKPTVIDVVEDFLQNFPNLSIVPVAYDVAREAARIRGLTGLRTADALVLGTASIAAAKVVVGNDERWRSAVATLGGPFSFCLLSDYSR